MDIRKNTELRNPGIYNFIAICLGAAAIAYSVIKFGYIIGAAVASIPFVLYLIMSAVKKPYWALVGVFIANYFIMGMVRYVPSLPGGIVMDCLIMFNLFVLLIRSCYRKAGWERAHNGLTVAALIWMIYCLLELFNPQTISAEGWFIAFRGYAVYFFLIAVLTPIIFYRYRDLKRILYIWSALTLLAVLKSYIQRRFGFDTAELRWLFVDGGRSTHIIGSGVRYFSFFSDAANFGSSMGLSMVVFSIAAIYHKNFWLKLYLLLVAAAAFYGMMISGTRSALAVPFAGYVIYLVLSKNYKIMISGAVILIAAFVFLNYTSIGQGNALVRRARSAFNRDDRSFVVRLENQKLMAEYMKDKPFGAGLGHGGGKAKRFAPEAYLSQIPTDSWFVMIWVETGVVGLVLHIGILLYVIAYGMWQVMFRLKDKQLRGLTAALIAGVFGVMVASYANEVFGQFPNGIIIYMMQAFIFMAPSFDREIARSKELNMELEHEYADEA